MQEGGPEGYLDLMVYEVDRPISERTVHGASAAWIIEGDMRQYDQQRRGPVHLLAARTLDFDGTSVEYLDGVVSSVELDTFERRMHLPETYSRQVFCPGNTESLISYIGNECHK